MKIFIKEKKLYSLAAAGILIIISIYIYNAFYREEPTVSILSPEIKTVSRFTSLVPGIFILNTLDESRADMGAVFAAVGFDVMEGSFGDYQAQDEGQFILLIPQEEAAALTDEQQKYILDEVSKGQKLITWGKSSLGEGLGIRFRDKEKRIDEYIWLSKRDVAIRFEDATDFTLFDFDGGPKVLAEDIDENAVMISSVYGRGSYLYSGISLADGKGAGYEHFPFIIEAIKLQFDIAPVFARNDLAFYVDMDYHKSESPEALAERIKSYGGDQIHLSAWYPKKEYENRYREIIEACHQRGITVVAWFELPFVSIDFWDKHPQWREKTAAGEDAHIDWRRLMALNDPEALEGIKLEVADLMRSFDWDGADIAEIYFESPGEGFEAKDKFTPMNDSFRQSFQERYGADPLEAFDPLSKNYWKKNEDMKQNLIDYRVELVTRLHEEFLLLCEELKQEKPYLKTNITVIDSIADENMTEHIGVDAADIVELQDKYHFTLQIEDPFTLWNLGPDRYRVIGEEYRSIMKADNELAIDINIIDRGGEVYPTKKQRGVELYQLINNAAKYTDKVILYALGTFEDSDMKLAPYAAGNDIHVQEISPTEYNINSVKRFLWNTDTSGKAYFVDGTRWPFVSRGGVLIPGGEHHIKIETAQDHNRLHIESVNGEVSEVSWEEDIRFSYSSQGRFYMTLSQKPKQVKVDGIVLENELLENGGSYTVVLPKGQHQVSLR